jgi:5-methylcytosine-specific restriction enzyme A
MRRPFPSSQLPASLPIAYAPEYSPGNRGVVQSVAGAIHEPRGVAMTRRASVAGLTPRIAIGDLRTAKPPPKEADPHYLTPEHRAWRTVVIERAGARCQWPGCGRQASRMFADHIHEKGTAACCSTLPTGNACAASTTASRRRRSGRSGKRDRHPWRAPGLSEQARTTIIVADIAGRVCRAIEIGPAHVDITVRRWEQLTGKRLYPRESLTSHLRPFESRRLFRDPQLLGADPCQPTSPLPRSLGRRLRRSSRVWTQGLQ